MGGCPGLHQPLSDFTQRLTWFGAASTSAVLATVLKVAPALSRECLWVIIKVLLFSGQVHGSVAFFYFFHNILMIDRSRVSCFFVHNCLYTGLVGDTLSLSFVVNIIHGFLILYLIVLLL